MYMYIDILIYCYYSDFQNIVLAYFFHQLTFPTSLGCTLISSIYGAVVTSQNG